MSTKSATPRGLGAAYEMMVAADLTRRGYFVYRSVAYEGPCDLVFITDDKPYRVEVKSVNSKIRHNSHFDFLALVETDRIFYTPKLPDVPARHGKFREMPGTVTPVANGVI